MMMIVDIHDAEKDFNVIQEELGQVGEETGVIIKLQREDIFDSMHRL